MAEDEKRKVEDYIIRTRALSDDEGVLFRHPMNPKSEIRMHRLSDRVGMQRAHLSLGRIPSGKESFLPHAHSYQEEFIFILEGEARLEIDGGAARLGPGDYVGFPIDGAVHHLINDGPDDLVYLMGGERTAAEVCHFPTLGKIMIRDGSVMRYIDQDAGEAFTVEDFLAPSEADTE